jgi:uncharacterized membrane protein YcfT
MLNSATFHEVLRQAVPPGRPPNSVPNRVQWVDYAKGLCIILVVMMHSTLGVEKAMADHGLVGQFIEWAKPFRMPDFFLLSGLFLARRMSAPWPKFADTKIVHFIYFYILWMTIQFLFKGYGIYKEHGSEALAAEYALGFVEPFGTLWFIYLLAVFFALTKALAKVPPLAIFVVAAALEAMPIHTGWTLIDEFAARYVYFFAGYWLAGYVFEFARLVAAEKAVTIFAALLAWTVFNGALVFSGVAGLPGISLGLGFAGAAAVIATAVMCARGGKAQWLQYLGANSIVVYLAFFVFMALSRSLLVKFAPGLGVDAIALLVTLSGIIGPVILHLLVKRTPLKYLFVRPQAAKLETWVKGWHSAAHEHSKLGAKELGHPQAR